MVILCLNYIQIILFIYKSNTESLIESMVVLRPRQGNLKQVCRLFSLVRGFASHIILCLYISTARTEEVIFSAQEYKNAKQQLHKVTERK